MKHEQLSEQLLDAAGKATPGEWRVHRGFSDWGMPSQHDIYVGDEEMIAGVPSMTPYCMGASAKDKDYAATQWANAEYIIAAQPANIRSLIEGYEAKIAQARRDALIDASTLLEERNRLPNYIQSAGYFAKSIRALITKEPANPREVKREKE